MVARNKCPKCAGPAYRVYAETTSPATHRSTKVTLPALWCGTLDTASVGGRTVGTFGKGPEQHGLVSVEAHAFAARRRQSVLATTRAHPDWVKSAKAATTVATASRKASAKPRGRTATPTPKVRPRSRKAARVVPEGATDPLAPPAEGSA